MWQISLRPTQTKRFTSTVSDIRALFSKLYSRTQKNALVQLAVTGGQISSGILTHSKLFSAFHETFVNRSPA